MTIGFGPSQIDKLDERIEKLEQDAHPPVPFESCQVCWAVVFADEAARHAAWHARQHEVHE